MPSYDVQFTENDVFNRFQSVRALKGEEKEIILSVLQHRLISDFATAFPNAEEFAEEKREFYGEQPNIYQRGYVDNLYSSGELVLAYVYDLLDYCTKKGNPKRIEEEGWEASGNLVTIMKRLARYLPATKRVLELGNIAPRQQRLVEDLDIFYGMAFYTYNLEFARDFRRDVYYLREDLMNFWTSQLANKITIAEMKKPRIVSIETNVDYFGNVVMPLIKNIQQHAFNPQNDIEGRLQNHESPFYRYFRVYSVADEENQQIVITIEDNGFGIRPEIQERLFERGVSTKADSKTEHGVGLWAAREFVEANGGKIWIETELGKGTSFKFTIPYREKDYFMYKQ